MSSIYTNELNWKANFNKLWYCGLHYPYLLKTTTFNQSNILKKMESKRNDKSGNKYKIKNIKKVYNATIINKTMMYWHWNMNDDKDKIV